jgi:hypothetical protein
MSNDDPLDDLKKGFGFLARAAKSAVDKLPTKDIEEAVTSGVREVGRALGNVKDTIEEELFDKKAPAASGGSTPPAASGDAATDTASGSAGAAPAQSSPSADVGEVAVTNVDATKVDTTTVDTTKVDTTKVDTTKVDIDKADEGSGI